jgi:hypothetical protein
MTFVLLNRSNVIGALGMKCLEAGGIGCEAWEKEIDERGDAVWVVNRGSMNKWKNYGYTED